MGVWSLENPFLERIEKPMQKMDWLIIDREAREMMHLVASVRPFICALTAEPFDPGFAEFSTEQSLPVVCLCVSKQLTWMNNRADGINRLSMLFYFS